MQPDVTVLIAAYDSAATLATAIDSALAQRAVSVEVVVVDDASRDHTGEIARAYADKVRLVRLEQNRGPGGARNEGLRQARGRWIAVLDSDDFMRPGRLAAVIERAENVGAQIAVDNLEILKDDAAPGEPMFDPAMLERLGELSLPCFVERNRLFAGTFNFGYLKPILLRSFLAEAAISYDETLRIGEDFIFLASALAKGGRCTVEPRAGYVYRVRTGSISRVLEPRHVAAMVAADEVFVRAHALDAEARVAFARRKRSLRDAASFLEMVEHIKSRDPVNLIRTAIANPAALRHLRMPVAMRFRRLRTRLLPDHPNAQTARQGAR